ncbi:proline hydroxylase [Streptomyces iconiensis]|uniref:Proline hydroxylase n=1 Tax=Streptomyces iconiensis TaxID=1384038 RepID=A0ABT6ZPH8_9ACTN|nr:proline hydroxylase [Streptomyces iconiensis]MDJ1130955.1 proline hydroxylase [Streptomyces iconiensis]
MADISSVPSVSSDPDPLFALEETDAFTERHVATLAAGTAGAVRASGFFGRDACERALDAVHALPPDRNDPARVPLRAFRFGPLLNDYRTGCGGLDERSYWSAADRARGVRDQAALRTDPVTEALERLAAAWGTRPEPATIGGRPVFGGTVRGITNGALIHLDELVREYPDGIFDQQVTAQLAFNAWVRAPESGGHTTVWRRRWHPADEAHREAVGYLPTVVDNCQHLRARPAPGAALLFNPANMHAVEPCEGHRVVIAFFLGLTTQGRLIYWS